LGNELIARANGVDLCIQTFGDSADPAILLIMGAAGSMDHWEDEFCERLAAGRRYVIRYDHRDTGRSVSSEPGSPTYTGADLDADAIGVLDALAVPRAHIVGVSMGGGIAQQLALRDLERVATLTLIDTSPAVGAFELPPMSGALRAVFEQPAPEPDWSDREAVIDHLVAGEQPFLGTVRGDDATKRRIWGRAYDRTTNMAASQTNHWILDEGEAPPGALGDIRAPTLVLHGTEDPLFPYPHGEALAREIPNARLVPLDGVGHEVPPQAVWDTVIPAILDHTATDRGPG
jgi:pimeloyl-ACP methyl ester carboxylesterase